MHMLFVVKKKEDLFKNYLWQLRATRFYLCCCCDRTNYVNIRQDLGEARIIQRRPGPNCPGPNPAQQRFV